MVVIWFLFYYFWPDSLASQSNIECIWFFIFTIFLNVRATVKYVSSDYRKRFNWNENIRATWANGPEWEKKKHLEMQQHLLSTNLIRLVSYRPFVASSSLFFICLHLFDIFIFSIHCCWNSFVWPSTIRDFFIHFGCNFRFGWIFYSLLVLLFMLNATIVLLALGPTT